MRESTRKGEERLSLRRDVLDERSTVDMIVSDDISAV
jgi:hypothetical protein